MVFDRRHRGNSRLNLALCLVGGSKGGGISSGVMSDVHEGVSLAAAACWC